MQLVVVRGAVLAVVAVVITVLANQNRNTNPFKVIQGIPVPAVIAIVLMIACTIALSKTTWGRHLYATGGNAEAARRAGIDVVHMKVTAFILCSSFGAFGGIMLASSQSSASLDLGSGNVLLFSVAAAVIGGTSLFGGRGKPRDAILGALVIAIIPNGLLLRPSLGAQWQQVITGIVLLLAAAVDAISRRRAQLTVSRGAVRSPRRRSVRRVALYDGPADPRADLDELLDGLGRAVLRTGHPRDRLLHQGAADVVGARVQHRAGAVDAELDPAGLDVVDAAVQQDPGHRVDGAGCRAGSGRGGRRRRGRSARRCARTAAGRTR